MNLMVAYYAIMTPMELAFDPFNAVWLDNLFLGFFVVDIGVNFRTAYTIEEEGHPRFELIHPPSRFSRCGASGRAIGWERIAWKSSMCAL